MNSLPRHAEDLFDLKGTSIRVLISSVCVSDLSDTPCFYQFTLCNLVDFVNT